jgi:hypothetical protein
MAQKVVDKAAEDMLALDEEEVDAIKSFLVRTLMKNTSLDREDIYSFIYGDGRKILWN